MDKIREGALVAHKLTHEVMLTVEGEGFDYLVRLESQVNNRIENSMKHFIVCRKSSGELARFALCELIALNPIREENNEGK